MSAPTTATIDQPVAVAPETTIAEPTPVPATVEEPKETAVTEATTEEVAPTTTRDVPETTTHEEAVPAPVPSKSNPTKRLSLFLGKAKNFVDKKVSSDKKKESVPAQTTEESAAEPATAEPEHIAAPAEATEEPVAATTTEEPVVSTSIEAAKPKFEKRKSILSGIFRTKSPVHNKEEVAPAVADVTEHEEPVVTDATHTEEANAAPTTAIVEEESHVAAAPEHPTTSEGSASKDKVLDQIKRSPIAKFFNKKKDYTTEEPAAAVEAAAPVHVEEHVAPVAAAEATPAAAAEVPAATTTEVVEPTTTATPAHSEEKPVARSGSPLGRRITQMFRGFSSKKKVPTVASTTAHEEAKKEEVAEATEAPAAEPTETAVVPVTSVEEPVVATHVEPEHEVKTVAPTSTTVQTTA